MCNYTFNVKQDTIMIMTPACGRALQQMGTLATELKHGAEKSPGTAGNTCQVSTMEEISFDQLWFQNHNHCGAASGLQADLSPCKGEPHSTYSSPMLNLKNWGRGWKFNHREPFNDPLSSRLRPVQNWPKLRTWRVKHNQGFYWIIWP